MTAPKSIYVTRPSLPPFEQFVPMLKEIWGSRTLTNGGPFHQRFEAELARYLGVPHVTPVTNATIGLMVALRALHVTGTEVITTPFSFVATGHSILWSGATPVFADIDPETMNLDPAQIEKHITPRTSAILAVHCYGRPCDLDGIRDVARRHNLKVLYDAAHAFAVRRSGDSVLKDDLSVLSFHATKVFNTFEGGAIISQTPEMKLEIDRLCNYGIVDELNIETTGLNAKMSEFNAALGLLQLQHVDAAIAQRRELDARYRQLLANVPGIRCVAPSGDGHNYYAFPILVKSGYALSRDALYERLREHGFYARRYFFPLISNMPMYSELLSAHPNRLPIANRIANNVLCLPLFADLTYSEQEQLIAVIAGAAR